jgi:transposase
MALGKRKPVQQPLFVSTADLPAVRPHPYYDAVNKVLDAHGFDAFVERQCAAFYAKTMGRPGLAPGVYFRSLMVGARRGSGVAREVPRPRRSRFNGDFS